MIRISVLFLVMIYHCSFYASSDAPVVSLLDTTLCDGFDYPCGDRNGQGTYTSFLDNKKYESWYFATVFNERYSKGLHPGVDINGSGKGDTDIRQLYLQLVTATLLMQLTMVRRGEMLSALFIPILRTVRNRNVFRCMHTLIPC